MSRRRRKADKYNPHRAARHRKEVERHETKLGFRATWTLLIVFDVIVACYSVAHYLQTGHREVILNVFVIGGVTLLGILYLPHGGAGA